MKSLNGTPRSNSIWILFGLMLSCFLSRIEIILASEDTWTYKADIPTARTWVGGAVLDGKIYVDDPALLQATWLMRNTGDVSGKTQTLTKEQWDSFSKYNLKNEEL